MTPGDDTLWIPGSKNKRLKQVRVFSCYNGAVYYLQQWVKYYSFLIFPDQAKKHIDIFNKVLRTSASMAKELKCMSLTNGGKDLLVLKGTWPDHFGK